MGNIIAKKIISENEKENEYPAKDIMCVKYDVKFKPRVLPKYNTDYCKCKNCMEILQYQYDNPV